MMNSFNSGLSLSTSTSGESNAISGELFERQRPATRCLFMATGWSLGQEIE